MKGNEIKMKAQLFSDLFLFPWLQLVNGGKKKKINDAILKKGRFSNSIFKKHKTKQGTKLW